MSQDEIDAMQNASTIIERFGGIRPMAAKVGAPVTTVQGWKKRDVIPGSRREDILRAANENNIDLSDITGLPKVAPLDKGITSLESPFIPSPVKGDVNDTNNDDIKITVEPILSSKSRELPPSFGPRSEPTHEDLMAVIAAGQKKAVRNSFITMLLFTVFAGGAAAMFLWPSAKKIEKHEVEIVQLENKVGAMNKDVQAMNESANAIKDMVPEDVRQKMADLKAQADQISSNVKTVAQQAQDLSKVALNSDAGSLSDRLSVMEAKFAEMQGGQAMKDLTARIRNLEVSASGQEQLGASVDELRKIVDSLDGQVSTLDSKLADAKKSPQNPLGQTLEGVSNNDLKAAAMLIAFSQLRESLNRNTPFADDVVLLQKLVGKDDPELQAALTKLAPQAEKGGVLTSEGLSDEFKALGSDIVFSSLKGEDVSMSEKAKVRISQMLNVKKDGQVVGGTQTQQVVAKAQEQLDRNDVQGAIATLKTLDGSAKDTAQPFIQQAEATVLADQIQNMLRQMIVSKVGATMPGAAAGVTTDAPTSIDKVTEGIENALPGQGVVKDDKSGFAILPSPKGFKGFSSVPTE